MVVVTKKGKDCHGLKVVNMSVLIWDVYFDKDICIRFPAGSEARERDQR